MSLKCNKMNYMENEFIWIRDERRREEKGIV